MTEVTFLSDTVKIKHLILNNNDQQICDQIYSSIAVIGKSVRNWVEERRVLGLNPCVVKKTRRG